MNQTWCLSDAECQFNKALIVEQAERIAKLEKVIVQLIGPEQGQEMLQIINTWPVITNKEVDHETTHGNES
jgi:hypothetical protein